MFNFLKKTDQKSRAEIIAKQAKIETVFEKGKIIGFFIILQKDGKKFISKVKDSDTLATIVEVIEKRIQNDDYEGARDSMLDDFLIDYSSQKENVATVTRVVSEDNYEPIFQWTPPA